MRRTRGSSRTVWWAHVVAALLLALGVSCGGDAGNNVTSSMATGSANSSLQGKWLTVTGFDEVTMTLDEAGTFSWENQDLGALGKTSGTWTAEANTLTFTFAEDGQFCPGETITWEYQLNGDTLTSEVVASTCPGPLVPESWEFERQPGT
jgi:hypothetical protein